jgi:hypothetical protein
VLAIRLFPTVIAYVAAVQAQLQAGAGKILLGFFGLDFERGIVSKIFCFTCELQIRIGMIT